MKKITIALPLLGLVIGTRTMASAGLTLLLADKLDREQRRAVGWTMLVIGLVTTIPLVALVFGHRCCAEPGSEN